MLELITLPYARACWSGLLNLLFDDYNERATPLSIPVPENSLAESIHQLGTVTIRGNQEGETVALAVIEIVASDAVALLRNRVGIRNLAARLLSPGSADGLLVATTQPGNDAWRFTFIYRETRFNEEGGLERVETPTRRYTYVLGPDESCRTPDSRFQLLARHRGETTLAHILDAFSVEKLSDEFFTTYKQHYQAFCAHLIENTDLAQTLGIDLSNLEGKMRDRALKPVRDFVKKLLGRLVFLHFIQKKGWLGCPSGERGHPARSSEEDWSRGDPDFLSHLFDHAPPAGQESFHSSRLVPLFFHTLNAPDREGLIFPITGTRVPYLNGGLFEPDFPGVEAVDFPAPLFAALLEFFRQYHFTIDENDPEDHEIGIDPEMLGRIFENLLEDNKDKGAYYTPKPVVQYMCQQSLIHALAGRFENGENTRPRVSFPAPSPESAGHTDESVMCSDVAHGTRRSPARAPETAREGACAPHEDVRSEIERLVRHKEPIDPRGNSWLARHATELSDHLDDLRICDPAIGSGAFPIGLLQEIYWTKLTLNPSLDRAHAKRGIIQHCIHGVDLDAGAVEIARLRFWLALIVDEDVPSPLPNLDYQIMQGNSLLESFEGERLDQLAEPVRGVGRQRLGSDVMELDLGGSAAPGELTLTIHTPAQHNFAELREEYYACHDPTEKAALRARIDAAVLQAIDARFTLRREELATSLRVIDSMAERKHLRGGDKKRAAIQAELDALAGKSSRLHSLLENPRSERPFFLWHLWFRQILVKPPEGRGGFDIVIANPPYIPMEIMASEERRHFQASYTELTRKFDSAAVFILHGLGLLNAGGCLTFISPVSWQTGVNYIDLRKTIFQRAGLRTVINLPYDIFAEAYVDTCVYLITKESAPSYRISLLPKRAKISDLATATFVEVASDLVCEPGYKLVLNPSASALLKRILARPDMQMPGEITKSTQGLAGNRFQRHSEGQNAMPFANGMTVTRYGVAVHEIVSVDMSDHPSLVEYYRPEPKLLIRRIISRQNRLIVGRCDDGIVFKKDVSPFLLIDTSILPNYLIAILNSQLLSWLYVNTSSIATKDDFRQTTLSELRALPIPAATPAEQAALSTLVDSILAAKRMGDEAAVKELEDRIDTHVFRLYGLTPEEIALVRGASA
jgi:hypothetical protein